MLGRRFTTAVIGLVAIAGLGACGGGTKGEELGVLTATSNTRFEPDHFRLRLNRETVITFQNKDKSRTHNFTLTEVFTDPDNFVSVDVKPGQQGEIKFTITKRPGPGFLTFYCRFHQSEGMSGRITLA